MRKKHFARDKKRQKEKVGKQSEGKKQITIWDLLAPENGVKMSWYFQLISEYFR